MLLFEISGGWVACVETHWHSPHLSANVTEVAMPTDRRKWLPNYISLGYVVPSVSAKAVGLAVLLTDVRLAGIRDQLRWN